MSSRDARWWALLLFSAMCLVVARAHAGPGPSSDSCTNDSGEWKKYRIGSSAGSGYGGVTGYIFPSVAAACSSAEHTYCDVNGLSPSGQCSSASRPWVAAPNCQRATGQSINAGISGQVQANPAVDCPSDDPDPCDPGAFDGDFEGTVRDSPALNAVPVGGSVCIDNDGPFQGCLMTKVAGAQSSGGYAAQWRITPDQCTTEDPSDEADEDAAEQCMPVGDGEYCAAPGGDGDCGYLNDKFICFDTVPEDGCKYMSDGSGVCQADAATPPVPDSGTAGTPATPDDTITAESADPPGSGGGGCGAGCNYFDPDTVAGSDRDPTDTGGGAGGGTNVGGAGGSGTPDDDDEDEELGEIEEPLLEETDCDYATCAQAFWMRLQAAPIVAAVADAGDSFPEGSCPDWTLEAFDQEYSLSAPACAIWDDVSPAFSFVFLAIWAWVATRIVLSA